MLPLNVFTSFVLRIENESFLGYLIFFVFDDFKRCCELLNLFEIESEDSFPYFWMFIDLKQVFMKFYVLMKCLSSKVVTSA